MAILNPRLNPVNVGGGVDVSGISNALSENRLMGFREESREQDQAFRQKSLDLQEKRLAASLQPKAPALQQNYNLARQQGFKGSLLDYQKELKRAGRSTTTVNVGESNKFNENFDKKLGESLANEFIETQKLGSKANVDLGDLQTAEAALDDPNLYTGTGGNAIQGLKKTAQTLFGVKVEGVASGEVLQRVADKSALAMKDQLPGPMSDADREFLQSLPANLITSPEGNRRIIKLGISQRLWQIERAEAARELAARNRGRLTPEAFGVFADIDRKWSKEMGKITNELRAQPQTAPRAPTVGTRLKFNPQTGELE